MGDVAGGECAIFVIEAAGTSMVEAVFEVLSALHSLKDVNVALYFEINEYIYLLRSEPAVYLPHAAPVK